VWDFLDAPWDGDGQRDVDYWRRLREFCEAAERAAGKEFSEPRVAGGHSQCRRLTVDFYTSDKSPVSISRVDPQRTATATARSREIVGPSAVMERACDRTSQSA
jgi:hypothetical protein